MKVKVPHLCLLVATLCLLYLDTVLLLADPLEPPRQPLALWSPHPSVHCLPSLSPAGCWFTLQQHLRSIAGPSYHNKPIKDVTLRFQQESGESGGAFTLVPGTRPFPSLVTVGLTLLLGYFTCVRQLWGTLW